MDFGSVIILVVAAVIVVGVFAVLISLRIRVAKAARRIRAQRQAAKTALWASAVVAESQGETTVGNAARARLTLTLDVLPPQGEPYQATAVWLVDRSALHLTSPGSHVPVKLVPSEPQKILPAVRWASYAGRQPR
jgi:type II secretory pathway pseudopilin PulG